MVLKLDTGSMADASHVSKETYKQFMFQPAVLPLRPPVEAGTTCYDEDTAIYIFLMCDLVRAGIKVPLAAGWATRIKEQLHYYPSDTVRIQFHANGALFFLTTDEAPDAAAAAGPVRWVMTFDLAEYRGVFRRALDAKRASYGEVA